MGIVRLGTHEGHPVDEAHLVDGGVEVRLMSYGAVLRDWRVPDRTGAPRAVTVGFERFEPYPQWSRAFGIIAGRVANRVRNGRFTLDGVAYQLDRNEGPHHLHGGRRGLGRRLWHIEAEGPHARLTLTSRAGDMGYPGTVVFTVDATLAGHTLTFDMSGVPDRPTPIALAQHSYYRLGGAPADHRLAIAAEATTMTDEEKLTTGAFAPVAGARVDFRRLRRVGTEPLDDNFCLTQRTPAAVLEGADMRLTLVTDRPGLQAYNAYDAPPIPVPGHSGQHYGPFCGIALEAQDWPDAVNHPHFPPVIATPERPYRQTTSITIAPR